MSHIAVIGVGNILQADDGVGVRALERFEAQGPWHVDFYDAGTAPFDLLGAFIDHDIVIVIDCVRAGRSPGTVFRLTAEALGKLDSDCLRFAHGLGVVDTVRVAKELGSQAEVVVFGVEPATIGWSLGLSPEVEAAMPHLLREIRDEVAKTVAV